MFLLSIYKSIYHRAISGTTIYLYIRYSINLYIFQYICIHLFFYPPLSLYSSDFLFIIKNIFYSPIIFFLQSYHCITFMYISIIHMYVHANSCFSPQDPVAVDPESVSQHPHQLPDKGQ